MIPSLFYHFNFIYIWWTADISPLSQFALMIVQKANEKMNIDEIEKKREQKLDISISNHEIWFLNFLRFTAFTILGTFKNFVIKPEALVLCHNMKKFADLWHLWGSIYEAKVIMYRSSHPEVFCKKVFLENLQKFTWKHLCRVSFLIKLQTSTL